MRTSQTIATNNNQVNGELYNSIFSKKQSKPKSTHAAAAAMIRKHIKSLGIQAKVTSESYSMGSSIHATSEDLNPAQVKQIEEFAKQFQYGRFDGMQDLYEYTNSRDDIPQVKFVFVNNHASHLMRQAVWDWVRSYFAGFENAPADAEQAGSYYNDGMQCWGSTIIHRGFSGALEGFWK